MAGKKGRYRIYELWFLPFSLRWEGKCLAYALRETKTDRDNMKKYV